MKEIQPQQIWNEEKMEGVKKLIQKQKLIDMMEQDEQLGLYEETKCYCGHTTTCDCGPEEAGNKLLWKKYPYHPPKDAGYWKDMFSEGAKWQQERSYSEEDMREAFIAGGNSQIEEDDAYGSAYLEYMEEWFEQFKKK